MHWHVRGVGDQIAVRIEQGAGKVEPLLDVHRPRRALQGGAHGLGDAGESAIEEFQADRIGTGGGHGARGGRRDSGETYEAIAGARRTPAARQPYLSVLAHDEAGPIQRRDEILGADHAAFDRRLF